MNRLGGFLSLALAILLVGVLVGATLYFNSRLSEKSLQVLGLERDLEALETELRESETGLAGALSTIESREADVSSLQDRVKDLENDIGQRERRLEDLGTRLVDAQATIAKYRPYMSCEAVSGSVDYSTLESISKSLSSIVRRTQKPKYVIGAYGERVWSNADVRYYKVTYETDKTYAMVFLVFPQREFGMNPGVFSIDDQCWVDLEY